jgi:citrate lyase beta subunit
MHEGKMLDAPIVERARKLVAEADFYQRRIAIHGGSHNAA